MIVINLIAPPGTGKSTGAAYIFSQLKLRGINAELVTEFAKDKVWENNEEVFKNQAYLFGEQSFRMSRCCNKVDVIVTDSPLILSAFYNKSPILGDNFNKTVVDVFNSYNNMNYLLSRTKPYNPIGRIHTEEESNAMRKPLVDFLDKYGVEYTETTGDVTGYERIISDALERFEN